MNEEYRPRRFRGSLLGPLILITLGLVFLLYNLGWLGEDAWSTLISLWPVLLIAMGLDGILRRDGLVGAALLIGLGTVFLLSNFGYLALNVWEVILRLWPVLLIAVGFDILVGRRSIWASLLGLVLVLVILVGSLWSFGVRIDRGQALPSEQVSQPVEGASQANVVIEPGAASLHLSASSETDLLAAGRIGTGRGQQVRQEFSRDGDRATLILRQTGGAAFFIPGGQERFRWELGLNSQIPIDLEVNLGAGEAVLDLTGLDLSALKVDMGVGQATVTLPVEGDFQAEVNGAVGQLRVIVPRGLAVQIQANTGIAARQFPAGYQQRDNTFTSPGYETAEQRVELVVGQAIGMLVIEER